MDIVCATCMEIISKVKFFKSNQNVIKECRSFCINQDIKQERDDKDEDCILIDDVKTPKTAEITSNINKRKHNLASTQNISSENISSENISSENQNESQSSTSSTNESPKMKKCKVRMSRLKLDNMPLSNTLLKYNENSSKKNDLEQSDSADKEKSSFDVVSPNICKNPKNKDTKNTPITNDSNVMKNIILLNKQKLSESSSTSTINSPPKNIKWIPVGLSQQSIHTDATTSYTRLSFVSNNNKCSPTILKLPSTLKINQIPSTAAPSFSKVALESLPKNNNVAFNSMLYRTPALPTTAAIQTGFGNQTIKTSAESKVDPAPGTLASSTPVLNQRTIKPVKIPTSQQLPRAQPFERINLPMKSDSHSTLERYRVLNSKIILRDSSKVKVLSVKELNKKPEQAKSQSTAPMFSLTAPSPGTLIGVVNPNNSNATELTVRFVRQSSKFCIIILLYGRIVAFNDLDLRQLQCLKRLLAKYLKTSVNHSFLLTHTPDEETLKLLRVLHIDHLLKRSY